MNATFKKIVSLLLAVMMLVSLVACGDTNVDNPVNSGDEQQGGDEVVVTKNDYTYKSYTTALGTNWNPHTWETSADDSILGYLSMPFVTMQALDTENGVYQWIYEMATAVTDVTADHQDDLDTYGATLPEGQTSADITEGYVFEIALNPDAKWENGEIINADDYIYSMQQLLNPEMKNYRANLYYAGESAVAGGAEYYYAGSTAKIENYVNAGYTMADLTKGDDGVYRTAEGEKVYIGVDGDAVLTGWLGGYTLAFYVNYYGEAYFGVDSFNSLLALADENGYVELTDDSLALLVGTITAVEDWGESEEDAPAYFFYDKTYAAATYDNVGCYKVDDYTIRYVTETYIDFNYFMTSLTSTWLVYEDLYEAGKDTSGTLVTTNYGTSPETTMSYGVYKIGSLQEEKQLVFVQNENWYGWEEPDAAGNLLSYTPYLVDGENVQRYQTTKVVIDVMDDDAAKQAFLKGELSGWAPPADELSTYSYSEKLYKVDETYTMSFFFNTNLEALQEMDNSKGNVNSVVLSNTTFRKAFSLAIDRAEFVTATQGYKPAFSLMNSLYHYDVYNDPTSSYRNSDEAMQAIVNLYGVEYGEGKAYATLKEAHDSITGYNLTEAKELMAVAYNELVEAGIYTGGDITIKIGWAKGALTSDDNKQLALMNKYINAAVEGTGFGTITLEAVGNISNRYDAVPAGEYAIGYGAWGGAAFYPFRNFQVYMDPDQYSINEAANYDPKTETVTLTVNGEEVTMTWQAWSQSMTGTGAYATADFDTKLSITAQLEELFLKTYYRIPLCGTTSCSLLSYQLSYFTENYNIMYGFGGLELVKYNYTDAEWADYVASQNGALNYE